MAKFGNRVKLAWLKGMEAIGKGASSLASNAHLKVTEINLESRRREILSEFPLRAQDLWQKGVTLPDPLGDMMAELNELDEKLSVLRAQRYARVEVNGAEDEAAQAESAAPSEDADDANDKGEAAAAEPAGDTQNCADESADCDTSAADGVDTADTACDDDRLCVDAQAPATDDAADSASKSTAEPQGEGDNA